MEKAWDQILTEEHRIIEKVLMVLEGEAKKLAKGEGSLERVADALDFFKNFMDGCHNMKEEKVLFPMLEQRGLPKDSSPIGVMLLEHEAERQLLSKIVRSVKEKNVEEILKNSQSFTELVKGHVWKEDDILYPMGKKVLSAEDGEKLVAGFDRIEKEMGEGTHERYHHLAEKLIQETRVIEPLIKGLSMEELDAILDTLPFEITFIDAEDTVRYFNKERKYKIFSRTRAIIGRKVQQCHPQKSLHRVNQIVNDFKSGKRDDAEFWIDVKGRKIYIRYFAVRGDQGKYLGTMEVTQDITDVKKIEGEKRLL